MGQAELSPTLPVAALPPIPLSPADDQHACGSCGDLNRAGARFCRDCGAALVIEPVTYAVHPKPATSPTPPTRFVGESEEPESSPFAAPPRPAGGKEAGERWPAVVHATEHKSGYGQPFALLTGFPSRRPAVPDPDGVRQVASAPAVHARDETPPTAAPVEAMAEQAAGKSAYLRRYPAGYLVLAMLAGAYVGFGVIISFAVAAPLNAAGSPFVKLVMGATFGIALSLVVFAGAELFTGNNLVMTVGLLRRRISPPALAAVWLVSFAGNLAGALALAWLVARSGVLGGGAGAEFVQKTAATKMHLPAGELFFRGVLCNWLVCLAVWSAMRSQSEGAKLAMIWWCLFAFVGAGFEHSVANMTLLTLGFLQSHGPEVSFAGFVHNLAPVTLGNIAGGALFVGGAYWLSARPVRLPYLAGRAVAPAAPAAPVLRLGQPAGDAR